MVTNMDMRKWVNDLRKQEYKKPLPILSFPSVSLLNITVSELIASAELQSEGMRLVAERTDAAASVSMMDLSVEAEAFGSQVHFSDDEVPTVTGRIIESEADADALRVPDIGGRPALYIDAIRRACRKITDRPVFAGVIGPYSLAGRLIDVSEIMINCYEEPDLVHKTLDKAARYLVSYINAYRDAGAGGVMMAEPLAGLLSPALMEEFSTPYVRRIIEETQTPDFLVIYHNCGNNVLRLLDSILQSGAAAYHFGNAISMSEALRLVPSDTLVMGNIDPAGELRNGTPASVEAATRALMEQCAGYDNFLLSSGCDIPPLAPWENLDAFFSAARAYYRAMA